MCSQVFLLFGIQNPNWKSKVFNNLSLKKWRSIIRKLFTGLEPTRNSIVAPTVFSLRNWGVNWYRTKRPVLASSQPDSSISDSTSWFKSHSKT